MRLVGCRRQNSKDVEDDGKKAIEAALAGHRSMKMVTIVDEDIDISNPVRVEWAMVTRWQPDRDTHFPNQKGRVWTLLDTKMV